MLRLDDTVEVVWPEGSIRLTVPCHFGWTSVLDAASTSGWATEEVARIVIKPVDQLVDPHLAYTFEHQSGLWRLDGSIMVRYVRGRPHHWSVPVVRYSS